MTSNISSNLLFLGGNIYINKLYAQKNIELYYKRTSSLKFVQKKYYTKKKCLIAIWKQKITTKIRNFCCDCRSDLIANKLFKKIQIKYKIWSIWNMKEKTSSFQEMINFSIRKLFLQTILLSKTKPEPPSRPWLMIFFT